MLFLYGGPFKIIYGDWLTYIYHTQVTVEMSQYQRWQWSWRWYRWYEMMVREARQLVPSTRLWLQAPSPAPPTKHRLLLLPWLLLLRLWSANTSLGSSSPSAGGRCAPPIARHHLSQLMLSSTLPGCLGPSYFIRWTLNIKTSKKLLETSVLVSL